MERGKRKNDKKTSVEEKKSKCNVWSQDLFKNGDVRVTFDTKHNQNFVDYYSKLNVVPQNEWESFYSKLKEPLPTTFRVVDGTIHTAYILEIIEKTQKECPGVVKRIQSFPGYVFQVNVSRSELRSTNSLRTFHQFLVHQSEIGTIFRQELVSMVPVLFMPVFKNSIILDMCAAPGSKTAQLLEALQREGGGLIIANDSCSKRGHMLIHRLRRLDTSSLFVTNHEASVFPTTYKLDALGNKKKITFSSVLCDVPCSGDGTLRKSPMMWRQFDTHRGLSLHRMQICILRRALELCEIGGTVVYSTCSFNPIENEAVVNSVLELAMGTISLNRSIERLDSIPCKSGLLKWEVFYKNNWYERFEDVPEDIRSKGFILETMFPDYRLDRSDLKNCIRFFPHLFNTGGFFVAVFHKLDKLRWKQKEPKGQLNSRTNDSKSTETHEQGLEEKNKQEKDKKNVLLLSEMDVFRGLDSESNKDLINKEKLQTQADFLSFEQYFNNDDNCEKKNEFWKSLGVRYGFASPPFDVWRRLLVRTLSQESPRLVDNKRRC
ncbi:RNA cytosine-C(5)-methyltransferase NSUN2-like isoform X2 [Hylaeus volcanicus]|uniref:RNA cytosine-C(5)-methyltransferase NSUN2-like isoform X2 n=1 Tax=Hylaeus volcanicus TaxID=313075 RepID=UPI0023B8717B|nr:RNA cytosine-C(5)-methyltransferase NSUN2-like isoform X2 [Hylaeus volcanicus]XP_053991888.1 RNA cytosine-C(5)-methyltransferase NSUN2-like isoform X2 [Hylaeus volcanicus]